LQQAIRLRSAGLLDDPASRPDRHAAEAGKRHHREGEKAARDWMRRSGSGTAPERPFWGGQGLPGHHDPKACFSGTVFLNHCPLYWGCRLAGYGNKRPSQ